MSTTSLGRIRRDLDEHDEPVDSMRDLLLLSFDGAEELALIRFCVVNNWCSRACDDVTTRAGVGGAA